jgi:hypothetical protein
MIDGNIFSVFDCNRMHGLQCVTACMQWPLASSISNASHVEAVNSCVDSQLLCLLLPLLVSQEPAAARDLPGAGPPPRAAAGVSAT